MTRNAMTFMMVAVAVLLSATACTKDGDTIYKWDPDEPTASTTPLVTVIYGQDALGDRSYNDLIYQGVEEAAAKYGLRTMQLSPTSYEEGRGYLQSMFQTVSQTLNDSVRRLFIVCAAGYDDYIRQNSHLFDSNPNADLLYLETPKPLAAGGSTLYLPYYGAMYEGGAILPVINNYATIIVSNPEDQTVVGAAKGFADGFNTDYYQIKNYWEEVEEKKGIIVSPHMVVRGNEKNYAAFLNFTLPEVRAINNVYYEDLIAKAILFKTADKLYGNKRSGNNIGEMKQVVVPYTLGLINHIVTQRGKQIDYYKIWKAQSVSEELSQFIYDLMVEVNSFIIKHCTGSHYIEWAKKEDCWKKVCDNNIWMVNWGLIGNDLVTDKQAQKRPVIEGVTDDSSAIIKHELSLINAIPSVLWNKFADWGEETGLLNQKLQQDARNVAYLTKNKKNIIAAVRNSAIRIYEIVCANNIELLLEADTLTANAAAEQETAAPSAEEIEITPNVVAQMVAFDEQHRVLQGWKRNAMKKVMYGELELTDRLINGFRLNYNELVEHGFRVQ